jgi:uncharacterized protein (UPF0371 family)
MNYRKGKEAQERVKRKIKYILLAVFSTIIAGLCVFSAFAPAASWKYYFSLPKVVICGDGEMRVHCMDAKNGDCTLVELPDGKIITGKTGDLLGASAAALVNALKELAGISHELPVLSPNAIAPIQTLKTAYLGSKNPLLHTDEVLIALSATAAENESSALALAQLPKLKGSQVHSTVLLSSVDRKIFKELVSDLTCEPKNK